MPSRRISAPIPIREAERQDIDDLVTLEKAAFPGDRLERRAFRHAIASPSIIALVAGPPGRLLGYVFVETRRNARVGRLSSIAVAPEGAGRGIGNDLADAAERAALARGCDRLRLEVRADNDRAVRLYERRGYRRIGRRPRYYEDGKAALRFEKLLGS